MFALGTDIRPMSPTRAACVLSGIGTCRTSSFRVDVRVEWVERCAIDVNPTSGRGIGWSTAEQLASIVLAGRGTTNANETDVELVSCSLVIVDRSESISLV
jgi:hypothetical protein